MYHIEMYLDSDVLLSVPVADLNTLLQHDGWSTKDSTNYPANTNFNTIIATTTAYNYTKGFIQIAPHEEVRKEEVSKNQALLPVQTYRTHG